LSELVFFTSNRAKLAHFKYIGTRIGVIVSGFREKTFYGSYHEPRLDDREALLRESYESALSQWRKKFGTDDFGHFFLEDTSVRIDALSTDDVDVPGVHVKYWMRDMDFETLDALILKAGGNRSATVRSDIVLHIPERIRHAMGIGDALVWFYGETKGDVVTSETLIKPNLLYPWLDNRTFNRWFVPEGFDVPISCLAISDANSVDFRYRAFKQAIDFLSRAGIVNQARKHASLQLPLSLIPKAPPVFLLCGYSCAGKTRLAQWLRDTQDYIHLEASDFMYQAFWRRHGIGTGIKIGDFAASALSQDPTIVPKAIAAEIEEKHYSKVVVSGFRSPEEVLELQKLLTPERDVQVIFLEASQSIRLERAIARGRDDVTAGTFAHRDEQESDMGLGEIPHLPSCLNIANDESLNVLFGRFATHCGHLLELKPNETTPTRERELEDLILLSLLSENKASGYTTREIAELVNLRFSQTKSKNNVSRYFQQDFHAYYEAHTDDKKIRYKLSNTGVSRALYLKQAKSIVFSRKSPRKALKAAPSLF